MKSASISLYFGVLHPSPVSLTPHSLPRPTFAPSHFYLFITSRGNRDTHPSPVTGSHPSLASNPSVAHPGFRPCRMSLKTPGFA